MRLIREFRARRDRRRKINTAAKSLAGDNINPAKIVRAIRDLKDDPTNYPKQTEVPTLLKDTTGLVAHSAGDAIRRFAEVAERQQAIGVNSKLTEALASDLYERVINTLNPLNPPCNP